MGIIIILLKTIGTAPRNKHETHQSSLRGNQSSAVLSSKERSLLCGTHAIPCSGTLTSGTGSRFIQGRGFRPQTEPCIPHGPPQSTRCAKKKKQDPSHRHLPHSRRRRHYRTSQ
uniref:Uncharacterized protein n=1 Tax=Arundo donax TaxID=35708 RepID=A0A0A9D9U9_ARUDO